MNSPDIRMSGLTSDLPCGRALVAERELALGAAQEPRVAALRLLEHLLAAREPLLLLLEVGDPGEPRVERGRGHDARLEGEAVGGAHLLLDLLTHLRLLRREPARQRLAEHEHELARLPRTETTLEPHAVLPPIGTGTSLPLLGKDEGFTEITQSLQSSHLLIYYTAYRAKSQYPLPLLLLAPLSDFLMVSRQKNARDARRFALFSFLLGYRKHFWSSVGRITSLHLL